MKTQNQEMIQQLMDEGDYAPSYPFVLKSKLTHTQKLLVTLMLNDIRMNGTITWKHQTYADKLAVSRQSVFNNIKSLTSIGIIIPGSDNKAGGKSNTYSISFSAISEYKTCKDTDTTCKDTAHEKPVKIEPQPVKTALHIKKPKENKENNKESLKKEEPETSFYSFMKGANEDKPKDEMDIFLDNLDI